MGCRMAYARHSGVRFSHQQHLHCPCLPPKNPPSGLKLTKISLPVHTRILIPDSGHVCGNALQQKRDYLLSPKYRQLDSFKFKFSLTPPAGLNRATNRAEK